MLNGKGELTCVIVNLQSAEYRLRVNNTNFQLKCGQIFVTLCLYYDVVLKEVKNPSRHDDIRTGGLNQLLVYHPGSDGCFCYFDISIKKFNRRRIFL